MNESPVSLSRPWLVSGVLLALVGIGAGMACSNYFLTGGDARWSVEGQTAELKIRGPIGWKCMEYTLAADHPGGKRLPQGFGVANCPWFGELKIRESSWPAPTELSQAPITVGLNQPTLVYRDPAGHIEKYVLIGRDRQRLIDLLKGVDSGWREPGA